MNLSISALSGDSPPSHRSVVAPAANCLQTDYTGLTKSNQQAACAGSHVEGHIRTRGAVEEHLQFASLHFEAAMPN